MVYLNTENKYESPFATILEIDLEGVLCASPGNEYVEEEEGNGGFI